MITFLVQILIKKKKTNDQTLNFIITYLPTYLTFHYLDHNPFPFSLSSLKNCQDRRLQTSMKATCKQYQKREEKVGILGRKEEARKDYEYINSLYSPPPLPKRGWIMARPRRRRVSRSNTREYNRGKVDWTGLLKEALRRHSVALDGRNPRIALGKFAWFEIRLIRHSCSLPLDSLWNGFARGYRGMQSRDKDCRLGVIIRS